MPDTTTAAVIMSIDALTFGPDDDLLHAAEVLLDRGLDGAVVVDPGGFVLGVVTLADLLYSEKLVATPQPFVLFDALLTWGSRKTMSREFEKMTAMTCGQGMSSPAITVSAEDSISKVASLMLDKGLTVIPVLNEDNTLLGVIGRRDVVRFTLSRVKEE